MPSIFQRISHCLGGQSRRESVADRSEEGAALHQALGRWTSALAPCPPAPAGLRSPAHLNQETLLDKDLPHASRMRDGTVLMASPHLGEAMRFVHACLKHRIDRVVDLRSAKEKQHGHAGPLDGGKSDVVRDHGIARFARQGRETPLDGTGKGDREDHVRTVQLSLRPGKKSPPPTGGKPRVLEQSLAWVRVHAGSGKAIAPERLLDVSLHLARTMTEGRTAFQCADGQHTGATFAAAHALLQAHLRDPIPADDLKETLMDVCLSIRRDRGPELFRAEDLAALMAFGRLMLERECRGALPKNRETPPPLPATRAVLPQAPASVQLPSRQPTPAVSSVRLEQGPVLTAPDPGPRGPRSILKKPGEASSRSGTPVSFEEGRDVRRFYQDLPIKRDFVLKRPNAAPAGKSAHEQLFGKPRPTTGDP